MLAFVAITIAGLGGLLFGTHQYFKGSGIWPDISSPFSYKTGVANTDINLRPDPSSNNDPIGLVTKNSKLRIVKSQDNWYQVDIVEQGRDRQQQLSTNRGWLYSKYVNLDQ